MADRGDSTAGQLPNPQSEISHLSSSPGVSRGTLTNMSGHVLFRSDTMVPPSTARRRDSLPCTAFFRRDSLPCMVGSRSSSRESTHSTAEVGTFNSMLFVTICWKLCEIYLGVSYPDITNGREQCTILLLHSQIKLVGFSSRSPRIINYSAVEPGKHGYLSHCTGSNVNYKYL